MLKIGEDSDDLVGVAEGGDEWDDGGVAGEVVEKRKLVLDACGGGCNVYFLDSDKFGFASRGGGVAVSVGGGRR